MDHDELIEATNKALNDLSIRHNLILRLLFGLGGLPQFTHQEIAEEFGINESDIVEEEKEALRALRQPPSTIDLRATIVPVKESPVKVSEISPLIETIHRVTPELIKALQQNSKNLLMLKDDVLEQVIAELLAQNGFTDISLVGRNPNTSADIFATSFPNDIGVPLKLFIEVKRWKNKAGIGVINSVYGAMELEKPEYGCNAAMVVCTSGFTDFKKTDRQSLELRGVFLRNRNDLFRWLDNYKQNQYGLWLPESAFNNK